MTTVFALHGFTGTPGSFDTVATRLPDGWRLRAVPLLGHTDCRCSEVRSFEEEVDRLAAEAATHAPPRHLLGYSLGGRIAVGLLVRHAHLFSHATILSAHPGLRDDSERAARRAADARWVTLLETHGIDAFVKQWEAQPLFQSQHRLEPDVIASQRGERQLHDPAGLARSLRTTGLAEMPQYGPKLAGVGVPMTWMVGALDGKFRAIAQALLPNLPHARLVVVADCGHNLLLEAPEHVASALGSAQETRTAG